VLAILGENDEYLHAAADRRDPEARGGTRPNVEFVKLTDLRPLASPRSTEDGAGAPCRSSSTQVTE